MSKGAPKKTQVVGVDDGFNNTKVVRSDGSTTMRPSRAQVGYSQVIAMTGNDTGVQEYVTEGTTYHAGAVDGAVTRHDEYPTSAINRVVVQHSLQAARLAGESVDIVTGLPVRMYFEQGERVAQNEDLITRKIENLKLPVTNAERESATVDGHQVLPEGFAAWFDYIIELHNGKPVYHRSREQLPIAIIDIGGRTTDYAVIADASVQLAQSGSINAGMLNIRERLGYLIKERFKMNSVPSEKTMDKAFASGSIRLFSKEHDVKKLINAACSEVVSKIRDSAQAKLGSAAELESVMFIGGGAQALGPLIDGWFPHQKVVSSPIYANARGMMKYGKYVA